MSPSAVVLPVTVCRRYSGPPSVTEVSPAQSRYLTGLRRDVPHTAFVDHSKPLGPCHLYPFRKFLKTTFPFLSIPTPQLTQNKFLYGRSPFLPFRPPSCAPPLSSASASHPRHPPCAPTSPTSYCAGAPRFPPSPASVGRLWDPYPLSFSPLGDPTP